MGSTRLLKSSKENSWNTGNRDITNALGHSELITKYVATSHNIENDQLCDAIEQLGYRVIRSETNVSEVLGCG